MCVYLTTAPEFRSLWWFGRVVAKLQRGRIGDPILGFAQKRHVSMLWAGPRIFQAGKQAVSDALLFARYFPGTQGQGHPKIMKASEYGPKANAVGPHYYYCYYYYPKAIIEPLWRTCRTPTSPAQLPPAKSQGSLV